MRSGDVRDDRAKSRPQPRRALWQAGQPPCAPRLGVGGPAPGVGGAGATSGPDVSPQPHPGGAGYRRRRPRGAARAEGAGTPGRAHAGRSGRAPRLGRGRGQDSGRAPIGPSGRAGPIRAARGAGPAPGLRATMGVPLAPREEGRAPRRGAGTRTHVTRGRGRGQPSPAPGTPRGIFLPDLLYWDSLEPRRGGERGGGRPFVRPAPPARGAAAPPSPRPRRGSHRGEACPLRRARGRRPRLGAAPLRPHPRRPRSWVAAPGDPGRPPPVHALPVGASRPGGGPGCGPASPAGASPTGPGAGRAAREAGTRRPRAGG